MIKPLLLAGVVMVAQGQTPARAPEPAAPTTAVVIPAGTKIPLRLAELISSHDAHTGQTFTFYVDQDVVVNGNVVIPHCAAGSGTVTLAGAHGINGHEGNLRLRFDTVTAADGSSLSLTTDEQAFNGTSRKALAFFTTRWINGDDVEVKPDKVLFATIAKDDSLGSAHYPAAACPTPAAASAAGS